MSTRRPLGTGPVPAVDDQGTPGVPVPRAVLAAERLDGVVAAPPVPRPAGRRPLSTGPTTTG
ncbi:hypothetical protein OG402_38335 [Streptomyces anulatus]|uniref:hypothetical protein n=1 Tax=Streptomyces anulatus TaxID=1892 RepID=UPI00225427E8|nr:hypothetical protein [Streptomyces anulatus]MCX4516070.1 hypothetical protein [Streptomyces anulatus]MCX4523299.1 hypothetical protein [Streptomyces anulatus]MCX4598897.1 hypothetical protein [Streptomyces anulatus]MCX4606309.1 hypothetical protein [Streptomyces anulatus]WSU71433.1 hypothetical protein OG499_00070 [Streptomyces anulatus]